MKINGCVLSFAIILYLLFGSINAAGALEFGDPVSSDYQYYTRGKQAEPKHDGIDIRQR